MCKCEELLRKIQIYDFNIQEAALFLDTHPCDRCALDYYHFYRRLSEKATREYNKCCGPLTNRSNSACEWQYIYNPWPWEGEE